MKLDRCVVPGCEHPRRLAETSRGLCAEHTDAWGRSGQLRAIFAEDAKQFAAFLKERAEPGQETELEREIIRRGGVLP